MSNGFDKAKSVIDKAHRFGSQNTALQQEALQAALGYLNTVDENVHWFCNDSARYAVVEAMSLFSFPETEALTWLKKAIGTALSRCHQCAEKYQVAAKKELRHMTTQVYAFKGENVEEYLAKIDHWDISRLSELFRSICLRSEEQSRPLSDQQGPGFEPATLCALFECLWCPRLCDSASFMESFKTVFLGIQEKGKLLRVAGSTLPAMYAFSFSYDRRLREWARKCFDKAKIHVTAEQFKAAGRDETVKVCRRLRNNSIHIPIFWSGMQVVLQYTDASAVVTELRDADLNLMDFICGEISCESENLQAVTKAINSLLKSLGSNLWSSCPLPAQEFGIKLIKNPRFRNMLEHPELLIGPAAAADSLSDCLAWTQSCVISQYGSNKYRVANEFLNFLLNSDLGMPNVSKIESSLAAMQILRALLDNLAGTLDKDSKRSFQVELRQILDTFSSQLAGFCFDSAYTKSEWSPVRRVAAEIIIATVQLDCNLLWVDYVSLSTTDYWNSKERKYHLPSTEKIWSLVSGNTRDTNIDLLQRFIAVVGQNIALIDTIEMPKSASSELSGAIELFNRGLSLSMEILNSVVRDVGGIWSTTQLKGFLSRSPTNEGMIALIFSPHHETFQEALNFLKETHEVEDRSEALLSSLRINFTSTAEGFIHLLHNWSIEGIFKSATRVVRTATSILDILFSPIEGLISTGEIKAPSSDLVSKLWRAFWRMLETTYRMALPWADRFDKADLVEFMRDVLECSGSLLNKFPAFIRAIRGDTFGKDTILGPEKQKELDASLLNECLKSIKSLTTWLRLNDIELLQTCVDLVSSILMKLADAEIKITDETVFTFERLITNSKKKKNCLTLAQRTQIYIQLCLHTENPESPEDTVILSSNDHSAKKSSSTSKTASVYDQMQLAAARKAAEPSEKIRLPNVSSKPSSRPSAALPVMRQTMTAAERAEFLRKRAGELPSFLQSKKPVAKNASAGAVRREESSASESDSGDDAGGLFATTDRSPIKKISEKRQTQRLENTGIQLVRRDPRVERNRIEQNIRARTNPDLTDLHIKILAWDPSHQGGYPPGQSSKDYSKLVNSYQTADRYKNAVEPLFLLETWQHIVSSRENIKDKDKFEMVLQTRSAVDKFVDLVATMSSVDWKKYIVTDPDLLMLATSANFKKNDDNATEYCLAKVQSVFKKKDIVEIGLRTVPNSGMVKHLRPTVQLYVVKLSGLTPIHREYASLKALPYYDLCDEIVLGRPTKGLASHQTEINKLIQAYGVNEPQARAIDAALQNTGFTLIQGPPGTGKTKTILGMVGAFLSQSRVVGNAINLPGHQMATKKLEIKKKKILLCAPSNAAVDEIVLRLKNGIFTSTGEKYIPKIVRMGMSDAINVNVQDVTLDALLDDMLNRADDKKTGSHTNDPTALREKLTNTLRARDEQRALLEKARENHADTTSIEQAIKKLNNQKTQLGEQLDELRDKQSQKARAKDIERKRFQSQILAEADVICATLSGSGHDLMASIAVDFETVIIDEACQTTELSCLIPLKYGCTRCVMVGDPNQLPPTVLSTQAVEFAYNESLFVRMQRNNANAVRLLAIQYRMHSSISKFPSQRFYAGSLLDGPEVDTNTHRAWHNSSIFGTYRFFDVRGREEESSKFSVYNVAEAKAALAIVQRLKEDFFDVDFDGRIGIITPYKEQHNQIRRLFQQHYGQNILSMIDFNTIDGFQGQEKDIIIFSCVRANEKRGIGFLSDKRRMNVGLTRAKSSVFILGHSAALRVDETWRALVDDAQERKVFTVVNSSTFASKTRTQQSSPKMVKPDATKDDVTTSLIKESVKHEMPRPQFDDTKAPPQPKSAIFQKFQKPAVPLAVNKAKAPTSNPMEITKDEPKGTTKSEKDIGDATEQSPIVTQPASTNNAVPKPSGPVKRKAEPSLFIKRKKPSAKP